MNLCNRIIIIILLLMALSMYNAMNVSADVIDLIVDESVTEILFKKRTNKTFACINIFYNMLRIRTTYFDIIPIISSTINFELGMSLEISNR